MRSSNPVFANLERQTFVDEGAIATHRGITGKTLLLFAVLLISGFSSIFVFSALPIEVTYGFLAFSGILAFIFAMVAMYNQKASAVFSVLYAVMQGLTYGFISYIIESILPGVAMMALAGTGVVFLVMFVLYRTGVLRASGFLRNIVLGSLITFLVGSLFVMMISLFNDGFRNAFLANPDISIGISLFLIVIGAFMLTLDFDRADRVVAMGLDKKAEWQVSLGFIVTLIMIYYNILRLIVTIAARNRN